MIATTKGSIITDYLQIIFVFTGLVKSFFFCLFRKTLGIYLTSFPLLNWLHEQVGFFFFYFYHQMTLINQLCTAVHTAAETLTDINHINKQK